MNIWLVNPYGPLPSEGWRDYSFITFGKTLSAAGHNVTWWTSNFSHHFKSYRSKGWRDEEICDGFSVRLVPSPSYSSNIGPRRVWRDIVFAARVYLRGRKIQRPDIIIYAESPLTFGFAGFGLARHHKVPIVYDQMDLWPELIVNAFPQWLRPLAEFVLWPVYWRRQRIFNQLDGVIALAEPYLRSVIDKIHGKVPPNRIIYNGIDVAAFRKTMQEPLSPALAEHFTSDRVKAIFAGSLGPSYDILTLIAVAKRCDAEQRAIQFYVAGDGPLKSDVLSAAQSLVNFDYLGVLAPSELPKIYNRCDVGLSCYTAQSNVEMPDKFYDYTAAGLAIVNSLTGEVADWIDKDGSGLQYQSGDADSLYAALLTLLDSKTPLECAKTASLKSGLRYDSAIQHAPLPGFLEQIVAGKNT